LRGSAAQVDHSVSQEGIQDHIYEFIQDYTLGSGQSIVTESRKLFFDEGKPDETEPHFPQAGE
jgi:hypothetical protein